MKDWLARAATRDLTASIVVFLVALPLCMGIAIASGVPPEKGLVTGIIGGLVVGALAGSPLQVSGPAAGLAVIVFEIVRDKGLSALGPILMLAGAIQVVAGIVKVGGWFRAISPAVVHGMLAGIGVLIVVGQFHVLFDDKPMASGLSNLVAMPGKLVGLGEESAAAAFMVGLITIGGMLAWEKFRPASLRLMPGALIGVTIATLTAFAFDLDVARVTVPDSLASAITLPESGFLGQMLDSSVIVTALAIAFIASAETLLSAAAVDKMHDGVRTDYNKELRAQGVGNLLCGVAGAVPMTGVIVRSSANVQAGALTRASAIFHGVWILAFVVLLPWLLREIPMSALAGVLVITGIRLVSLAHVKHLMQHYGPMPAVIWAATLIMVVATDLLTGVLTGLALSLVETLPHFKRLRLHMHEEEHPEEKRGLALKGSATFLTIPKLSAKLDTVEPKGHFVLNIHALHHVDHSCAEMIREWMDRMHRAGAKVEVRGETRHLKAH